VKGGVTSDLVRGVECLSLDAGNTVIFLDHGRLARLLGELGHHAAERALIDHEGEAKRLYETNGLFEVRWSFESAPGAGGWGRMVGTIVKLAGVPEARVPEVLAALWKEHVAFNLWSAVPPGLGAALDALAARGIKVVVVSNSEGMLAPLFSRLGIASHFDAVVDSGLVGVEKPHPKIFRMALEPFGIAAENALHLGDTFATDIVGARAAGLRSALIDPFGHYEGLHPDVPRVPSVVAVAEAILLESQPSRK
jgi:HAD superfamily hydrolase (TIGR01509 family)